MTLGEKMDYGDRMGHRRQWFRGKAGPYSAETGWEGSPPSSPWSPWPSSATCQRQQATMRTWRKGLPAELSFALLPLLGPQHLCPESLHPPALSGSSSFASSCGHHAIKSGPAHPSEINGHHLLPGCGGQAKATRQRREGKKWTEMLPELF